MKSRYLAKKLLDHTNGVSAYAMPAIHLALFTSVEGLESGSLAHEVTGGGYARKAVSMAAAADFGTGGKSVSALAVDFDAATADWGAMVGWALMDAATAGNVLHYGELPKYGTPADYKRVFAGDSFRIPAGSLTLSEL